MNTIIRKTVTISTDAYSALNKKIDNLRNENDRLLNIINTYRDRKIHEYQRQCDLYTEEPNNKPISTLVHNKG